MNPLARILDYFFKKLIENIGVPGEDPLLILAKIIIIGTIFAWVSIGGWLFWHVVSHYKIKIRQDFLAKAFEEIKLSFEKITDKLNEYILYIKDSALRERREALKQIKKSIIKVWDICADKNKEFIETNYSFANANKESFKESIVIFAIETLSEELKATLTPIESDINLEACQNIMIEMLEDFKIQFRDYLDHLITGLSLQRAWYLELRDIFETNKKRFLNEFDVRYDN